MPPFQLHAPQNADMPSIRKGFIFRVSRMTKFEKSGCIAPLYRVECQTVTLAQDVVDVMDGPLPPAGREAGAERRDAHQFERGIALEQQVTPRLPAGKPPRLAGQTVQGIAQGAETSEQLGGFHRLVG